jgi:hypothetical protein
MAKRVEVKTELTAEELHERYRKASESVKRTHWHILTLTHFMEPANVELTSFLINRSCP